MCMLGPLPVMGAALVVWGDCSGKLTLFSQAVINKGCAYSLTGSNEGASRPWFDQCRNIS